MKVLDLFSGIGGFSLGLERAGFETVGFCEIDPACQKVLKKHWPKVPLYGDIKMLSTVTGSGSLFYAEAGDLWPTRLNSKEYGTEIDVICGGFPCQDISIGGARKGIVKGTRSSLWKEYWRLINEIKPRYVIIENVERLRKAGLGVVLNDLHEIGYDCEWHCIPAAHIGLPHQRDRVWVIAYPRSERRDECLGEKRHLQANEERANQALHGDGEGCESESLSFRSLLSRGEIDSFSDSLTDERATIAKLRRVTNGVPAGLDERRRKQRIKQLGNAIVPYMAQLIGEAINEYEFNRSGI